MLVPIPVLNDNYVWIYQRENSPALVVDMGDFKVVNAYLNAKKIAVEALLITHNHQDHIGGLADFKQHYPQVKIYGLEDLPTQIQTEHYALQVFASQGHSQQDFCYLVDGILFTGDVLFSAGCGKVFTGNYASIFQALQAIKQLPPATQICPAHEYTISNLNFALSVVSDNQQRETISANLGVAKFMQTNHMPTLPSTLNVELAINPFLKAHNLEKFTQLRKAKDDFKG